MQPRASVVRATLSLVVVAALIGAGSASAATKKKTRKPPPPKPVCHLLAAGTGSTSDQSLKITSADVATNATTLTYVIRVAKLTTGADSNAPTGREWQFGFRQDGHLMTLAVDDGPFGTTTTFGLGKATLDTVKNEVRVTIGLRDLSNTYKTPMVRSGATVFTEFTARTESMIQMPSALKAVGLQSKLLDVAAADSAQSTAKYVAGYPSCVQVGS